MKDEYVDIVDEKGSKFYSTSKKEAHKKGLLHCCVIAEIIDSKGRWMLIIPQDHKQDFGQYVSPVGGHVSAGEKIEAALKRETLEEVGIKAVRYKRIGKGIFDRKILGRRENHCFEVFEIYTNQKPKLSDEGKSYKYFTKKEIKEKMRSEPKIFGDVFHFIYKNIYKEFKIKF